VGFGVGAALVVVLEVVATVVVTPVSVNVEPQ
jgi:hypothetical protein